MKLIFIIIVCSISTYDAAVNLSAIKRKMQLMEWDKYFASSKSKLDADDYVGALSQLETLMSIQTKSDKAANTHDTFPMTTMLAMVMISI